MSKIIKFHDYNLLEDRYSAKNSVIEAKMTQRSLDANLSAFIVAEDWSLRSSDLNHLDYRSWNILEEADYRESQNNGR